MKLKVEALPEKDLWKDMIRIPYAYRRDGGEIKIPSSSVCKITANGKSRLVAVRGCPGKDPIIQIELKLRTHLGLKVGQEYDFKLAPASSLGYWRWAWKATDPAYRVPAQISLVSFILGLIGLLLGVIGAWPVFHDWINSK